MDTVETVAPEALRDKRLSMFSQLLKRYMTRAGMSGDDLAGPTGIDAQELQRLEAGQVGPTRQMTEAIIAALSLDEDEANDLRQAADRDRGRRRRSAAPYLSDYARSMMFTLPDRSDPALQQVQAQLQDMQRTVEEMSVRLQAQKPAGVPAGSVDHALIGEIEDLKEQLNAANQTLTAPVLFPTAQAMSVRLAPVHQLDSLDEYRGDESKLLAVFGVFVGAILGVFVNVATGGKMEAAAWIILVVFLVVAALFGYAAWEVRKRGSRLKSRILDQTVEASTEAD